MPWATGEDFASRHNHKLKGAAASKAAEMATAMVREGVPEVVAIATANKHGDKMQERHALGGGIGSPKPFHLMPMHGIGSSAGHEGAGGAGMGSSMQTPSWTRSASREMQASSPKGGGGIGMGM